MGKRRRPRGGKAAAKAATATASGAKQLQFAFDGRRVGDDGIVLQALLLNLYQYVLNIIGVLSTLLHPNAGWIFLPPAY